MRDTSRVYYPDCRALLELAFDNLGSGEDSPPLQIVPVLPRRATIHKNSYYEPDSWSIEFDMLDLPIDPELIRAGAVSIYLVQVPGVQRDELRILSRQSDALTVGSGESERPGTARSQRQATLERSRAAVVDYVAMGLKEKRAEALRKFTYDREPMVGGLFDETSLELNESGGSVQIQGQDYTDFLIKLQWPPKGESAAERAKGNARPIPVGRRLDTTLNHILATADPSKRLRVKVRDIELGDLPTVGKNETRGKKRGIPVEQDTSYWDVITKLAARYGLIVFVDGVHVVLTRAANLTAENTELVRYFAWGENLSTLNLKRRYAKQQVPQIVMQGYDDKKRKPFEVRYPDKGDPVPTAIGVKKDEFKRVPARGIKDKAVLKEMAKALFVKMGRTERSCTFSTHDLTDMREDDLLSLRAGSPVSIQFDTQDFHDVIRNPGVDPAAKVQWLVNRGYGEAIAQTIAKYSQKLEALSRPLRVNEVTFNYDATTGISIEAEASDFIVVGGDRLKPGAIE